MKHSLLRKNSKKCIYLLSSDGHRDSANLSKCAMNEDGLKSILIDDAEEIGWQIVDDSILIDYDKKEIRFKYTIFNITDDISEGKYKFLIVNLV